MKAKHTFKYTYEEGCEQFSPVDVTFELPADITISQMLYNFEFYLKACGFIFDGHLEIVEEEKYDESEVDDTDYCCMGDTDGLEETSSSLEVEKNKWVHGMCNPPSPDWKKNQ
jgi:hypothetical protein